MSAPDASGICPVPAADVRITGGFWAQKQQAGRRGTLPACIRQCEETERINNFRRAAGTLPGPFVGNYYDDSDVYKVLEGMAHTLAQWPDAALERKADEWIDIIAAAQQPDGYLVCYFILQTNGEPRWTDMERHEDYCLGHLIEAAVAYKRATGKGKLLAVATRFADCFAAEVGEGKRPWVPGHQEVELALVKLYEETGGGQYLALARWLLNQRGHGHGMGGGIWGKSEWGPRYAQDDIPVQHLRRAAGHAVRAMYLYTAMGAVARHTGSDEYLPALARLWESVVHRNMYVTGGVGSSRENEGFTADYDLPAATAYCETCAAAGMAMWNQSMGLLWPHAHYADVVETELYNSLPAGVNLAGDRFFYVNPLASDGAHHRVAWYGCSCCPTQLARFMPQVGGYAFAAGADGLWINQYMHCTMATAAAGTPMALQVETAYPWQGGVRITLQSGGQWALRLRLPGWCRGWALAVNGKPCPAPYAENGYLLLRRAWQPGDTVQLTLAMPPRLVAAHPAVRAAVGRLAVARGPVVYCAEGADGDYSALRLGADTPLAAGWRPDWLGGACAVTAGQGPGGAVLLPYHLWGNRAPGPMDVWLPAQTF